MKILQINSSYSFEDRYKLVEAYYKVLLKLNNVDITEQQVKVLAMAGVYGDISTVRSRNGIREYLKISIHSLNNAVSKLTRKKLLVKGDRTRVIPALQMDFSKDLQLIINLKLDDTRPTDK